MELVLVIR